MALNTDACKHFALRKKIMKWTITNCCILQSGIESAKQTALFVSKNMYIYTQSCGLCHDEVTTEQSSYNLSSVTQTHTQKRKSS